ncbi:DUF6221 family protein [Nocardiopsis sediminis]|uniref:DUF6221 family protein n=1 Tax=Nocardiopsis sediminis TaxID=1778267 RepID=A0ABV8FTE8_9ACTN
MTIVEFLFARLDEDERAAHAASSATGGPSRARADVDAKRRIVRGYVVAHEACMNGLGAHGRSAAPPPADAWAALHAWRRALEHLAAVYETHPDYEESWRG